VPEPGERAMRFRLIGDAAPICSRAARGTGRDPTSSSLRHAVYYTTWAEQFGETVWGPHKGEGRAPTEREHDNIRAALRWLIQEGETEYAQRLSGTMGPSWQIAGRMTEGRAWLTEVRGLPAATAELPHECGCSTLLPASLHSRPTTDIAGALANQALELGRDLGDNLAPRWRCNNSHCSPGNAGTSRTRGSSPGRVPTPVAPRRTGTRGPDSADRSAGGIRHK